MITHFDPCLRTDSHHLNWNVGVDSAKQVVSQYLKTGGPKISKRSDSTLLGGIENIKA